MTGGPSLQLQSIRKRFFVCPHKVGQVLSKKSVHRCIEQPVCILYPYENLPILGVHDIPLAGNSCIQTLRVV
jgi:hypothetical protein